MRREIFSERFVLRPIEPNEVEALHQLWIDERVRQFLWDGKVVSFEETAEIVEKNHHLFHESGFGIWGIHKRESPQLLGFAGYWYFRTPPSLELLFGVSSDHWNRGIATEATDSVIRYGFGGLDFPTIEASTDVANTASQRVINKLGMTLKRRTVVDGLDTLFYSLQREDWETLTNSRTLNKAQN
jgi:RimJ/RimL family protein N-acetyltransferase